MNLIQEQIQAARGSISSPSDVARIDCVEFREGADGHQADAIHRREHRSRTETLLHFFGDTGSGKEVVGIRDDLPIRGNGPLEVEYVFITIEVQTCRLFFGGASSLY